MAEEDNPVLPTAHIFTCPHCSHQLTIQSSNKIMFREWVTCGNSGRQFLIGQQRTFKVIAYLHTPIDVIQHAKYTRRNHGEENPPSDKVVEYNSGGGSMRSLRSRI